MSWHVGCFTKGMIYNRKDFRPLVCAWHDTRKHWAQSVLRHAVSHGICELCKAKMMREIRTQKNNRTL